MKKPIKHIAAGKRKQSILEAAKEIFLEKGFSSTTMEDVIARSGTSKGGVYYHFKSTKDMLVDLMKGGSQDRYDMVTDYVSENAGLTYEDMITEIFKAKLFDQNDFKTIYAMFLVEAERNEDLKELEKQLMDKSNESFIKYANSIGMPELKCFASEDFLALMKVILVGTEMLGVRDTLMRSDGLVRDIVLGHLKRHGFSRDSGKAAGACAVEGIGTGAGVGAGEKSSADKTSGGAVKAPTEES